MVTTIHTDAENPDFITLVKLLDADLAVRDGDEHAFYNQFNKIDTIKHTVIAYADGKAVSCGAIKYFDPATVEVKRMYTLPSYRGRGIASQILKLLEHWALAMNYRRCVLETGRKQSEAIALYQKNGYRQMLNYGQYAGVENSVCFEKELTL